MPRPPSFSGGKDKNKSQRPCPHEILWEAWTTSKPSQDSPPGESPIGPPSPKDQKKKKDKQTNFLVYFLKEMCLSAHDLVYILMTYLGITFNPLLC